MTMESFWLNSIVKYHGEFAQACQPNVGLPVSGLLDSAGALGNALFGRDSFIAILDRHMLDVLESDTLLGSKIHD